MVYLQPSLIGHGRNDYILEKGNKDKRVTNNREIIIKEERYKVLIFLGL